MRKRLADRQLCRAVVDDTWPNGACENPRSSLAHIAQRRQSLFLLFQSSLQLSRHFGHIPRPSIGRQDVHRSGRLRDGIDPRVRQIPSQCRPSRPPPFFAAKVGVVCHRRGILHGDLRSASDASPLAGSDWRGVPVRGQPENCHIQTEPTRASAVGTPVAGAHQSHSSRMSAQPQRGYQAPMAFLGLPNRTGSRSTHSEDVQDVRRRPSGPKEMMVSGRRSRRNRAWQ